MLRAPNIRVLLRGPLLLGLALTGCLSGTSTDTDNTLAGVILQSDGRPATGAVLAVRSGTVVVGPGDRPEWKTLGGASADGQGRFAFAVPPGEDFYLEARNPGDSGQVFFAAYAKSAGGRRELGSLRMVPTGACQGRVAAASGKPVSHLWIGIPGFSAFARLDAPPDSGGVPFALRGLPPGPWVLTAVSAAPVIGAAHGSRNLAPAEIASGSVLDLGKIVYDDTRSSLTSYRSEEAPIRRN